MRMYDKEQGKYAPLRRGEPAVPGRGDIIINCFTTAIILTFDPLAAALFSADCVSRTVTAAIEDFVKIIDELNVGILLLTLRSPQSVRSNPVTCHSSALNILCYG